MKNRNTVQSGNVFFLFLYVVLIMLSSLFSAALYAQPSGEYWLPKETGGYLFAHMTKENYGRLYYSISKDGLNWHQINNGNRILEDYLGHPDICKGRDGIYYLLGNRPGSSDIRLYESKDLIDWKHVRDFQADMSVVPQYEPLTRWHGAAKMFYDDVTDQYIITWHSTTEKRDPKEPERFWAGMRTLYILTKDFKTFTKPKRLFDFEIAVIDVCIRKEGDIYYAIIKDERYPSDDCPTGKTIRICSAPALTGPYTKPSPSISPKFREAPNVIPQPDGSGWYIYYEKYPGQTYQLSKAPSLEGPWQIAYSVPGKGMTKGARHGGMVPLSKAQYEAIKAAFPNTQN